MNCPIEMKGDNIRNINHSASAPIHNILWVDDEIHHLKPHILFLEEKGYNLTQVTNGQDAVALINENSYDLILLDHSMPGMDGLETLKRIKRSQPNKIVILITKTEDEWLMNEAIAGQVEQFLTKPVNPLFS